MNNQLKETLSKNVQEQIKPLIELNILPDDLRISTITITCRFDTLFNLENIEKYMKDSKKMYIKPSVYKENKKRPYKSFYNQITLKIASIYKTNGNPTNVKIFNNGAIQMTGCTNSNNFIEVLTILCKELTKVRAILEPKKMEHIIRKPFITNPKNVGMTKILDFRIRMINSNFNIGFSIDREAFYEKLLSEYIECSYEPCVHACVNIKYNYRDISKVSIFVFESGAIIITGAKSKSEMTDAYAFITTKIYDNYKQIVKNKISDILTFDGMMQLIKENS